MGAQDPPDMDEVGMKATIDSRPIHRVYVDGFSWIPINTARATSWARAVKAIPIREQITSASAA